ncbi:MAG: hypothetical protein E7556_01350 [Ruminococcaceae bacterium]|nr:hypothetical protein [Oscillospiraceae bacterium]
MQFKIKNTKITISFTFFALIIILISLDKTEFLYTSIVFALAHELGHLLALKYYKVSVREFKISLFGGNIKVIDSNKMKYYQTVIVSFSGPFVNLCFVILFYIINTFLKNKLTYEIYAVNFVLALFNLLPFYNFDGGKILSSVLLYFFEEKMVNLIITITSFIILIPFTYLAIYIFSLNFKDFYLLVASLLMLLTIIFKK